MLKQFRVAVGRIPQLFLEPHRLWSGLRGIAGAICRVAHRILRREGRRPRRRRGDCCIDLPPELYKRPDPLIYAQYYLMKMGLAVTWDNPDIELFEPDPAAPDGLGAPVAASALTPNRPYKVRVRVWNGSYEAPAVGLPVHLSFLSFGSGTVSTPIGTRHVDLGVKGSPHHPAFAPFDWTTPGAGHYCLQARLEWSDDANPENNLGQQNVDVGVATSPASFTFVVRNEASVPRRFTLEADAYRLPDLPPCDDPGRDDRAPTRLAESRARWQRARRDQAYGRFPVPAGWVVSIEPREFLIASREERTINVLIEPTALGIVGPAAFNIHSFAVGNDDRRHLIGGVTLYVTTP